MGLHRKNAITFAFNDLPISKLKFAKHNMSSSATKNDEHTNNALENENFKLHQNEERFMNNQCFHTSFWKPTFSVFH